MIHVHCRQICPLSNVFSNKSPSKDSSKEIDASKTKGSSTTTTVASTPGNTAVTADVATDTRHGKAELAVDQEIQSSQNPKDITPNCNELSEKSENNGTKAETFAKPKIPLSQPKPKPAPPLSSLSMLLEGLKSSAGHGNERSTKTEKRSRKHHDDLEVKTSSNF